MKLLDGMGWDGLVHERQRKGKESKEATGKRGKEKRQDANRVELSKHNDDNVTITKTQYVRNLQPFSHRSRLAKKQK